MHRVLSNPNDIEVDQLDDADGRRIETATTLLEKVSLLTPPEGSEATTSKSNPDRLLLFRSNEPLQRWFIPPSRGARDRPASTANGDLHAATTSSS